MFKKPLGNILPPSSGKKSKLNVKNVQIEGEGQSLSLEV
jgi:hypothetical protein